jgi:hypothetical protein
MMKGVISLVALATVAIAESVEYAAALKGALAKSAHHTFRLAQLEVAVDSKGPMDQVGTLCYQQLREISEEVSALDETHQKFSTQCASQIGKYKTQQNALEAYIAKANKKASNYAVHWNNQRPKIPPIKKRRERLLARIKKYEIFVAKKAAQRAKEKKTYDNDMVDFNKALADVDMLKKILKNSSVSNGETSGNIAKQGFFEAVDSVGSDRMRMQSNRLARAGALLEENSDENGPSGVDKVMNLLLKIRNELWAEMDRLTKIEKEAISLYKKNLLRWRARINAMHMRRARYYMRVGDILRVIGRYMIREASERMKSSKAVKKIDQITIDRDFLESECAAEPPLYEKSRSTKMDEIKTIKLMLKILKSLNWSGAVYSAIARISVGGIDENPEPGFDLVAQMDIGTGLLTNNYNIMNKDYKDFGRVAIKLSIGSSWVWASFDSWSPKIQDYFMPTLENARVQQRYINNLVIHKSPSAEVMTGSSAKGNVEMWANNYAPRNAKKIPGAHDGLYDFGDHRAGGGSHGCFQVHDYLNKQTVLAVNELRKKGRHAVGIGNRKIGPNKKLVYPDWTYAANIATYTKRNEAVRVTWFFQPKNYGKPKTSDKKL